MYYLIIIVLLAPLWGCNSQPAISEEALLKRHDVSNEDHELVKRQLTSSDSKEIHQGLLWIQKHPQSLNLFREEVMQLNKNSADAQTIQVTTEILSR